MLLTNDIGRLFAIMQASYGARWTQKPDAIPVWQEALKGYTADDVMLAARKAISTYPDFPPTVGQFVDMVDFHMPQLPAPGQKSIQDEAARADRIYAYTKPKSPIQNPKGNDHHVRLPESVAQRIPGESLDQYEKRIADEVTFALYPRLRPQFENR